jgi:hypothetical protein
LLYFDIDLSFFSRVLTANCLNRFQSHCNCHRESATATSGSQAGESAKGAKLQPLSFIFGLRAVKPT